MHHYFEAITNTAGQSLIGYFVRVIDPATQSVITLASDNSGTPISVVSGVADMAKTDEFGNVSLYVTPGTYNVEIYGPDATSFLYRVPNVAMNSSKGDQGDPGPAGPQGEGLADVKQPTGSGLVGFDVTKTFPAATTGKRLKEAVYATDAPFNAKCDGTTDDTTALAAAIAFCLSNNRDLIISGPMRLTGSVLIDRPADSKRSVFSLIGQGENAGFIANTAITLFDTSLAAPSDGNGEFAPISEYVRFDHLRFFSPISGAYAISGKMFRVMFAFCEFVGMDCMNSPYYAQEIKGVGNTIQRSSGRFLKSQGAYAVQWHSSKIQFCGLTGPALFDLHSDSGKRGIVGCSFHQNEIEGNGNGFVRGGLIGGLSMSGNYCEFNAGKILTVVGNNSRGIAFTGNYIGASSTNKADTNWWEIDWGGVSGGGFFSAGNFCDGRLHDDSQLDPNTLLVHDNALLGLRRGTRFNALTASGQGQAQRNVVAAPGGGAANAVQITAPMVYISDAATAGDSVKLPLARPGSGRSLTVTIYNIAPQAVAVFPNGSDTIFGVTGSYSQPSGTVEQYTCFNDGLWIKTKMPS